MANPFEGSSSSKNPFGSTSGSVSPLTSGKGTLTAEQALHLAHILATKPQRSFWGDVKAAGGDVLHPVEYTFDKLMRPSYAIASGVDAGITKGSMGAGLHGAREGFMGRNKEGFGQVLQHHGVLEHHNFLRGLAGFGLDVASDPLTYLTGGVEGIAGHTAGDAAGEAVMSATARNTGRSAAKRAAEELKGHVDTLKAAGPDFTHRAALGETKMRILKAWAKGHEPHPTDWANLSPAEASAREEFKLMAKGRGVSLNYKLPFLPKVSTPALKVPLPTMEGTAAAGIPGVSKAASAIGHAFVGGYTGNRADRLYHRLALMNKHQGEEFATRYFNKLRDRFQGVENLKESDQVKALHFFEKEGGVVKQGGKYRLAQKRIAEAKKAGITDKQIAFVKAIHDTSEMLAEQDTKFGIKYEHLGKLGKLYVPHITAADAEHLGFTQEHRSLLTARGYMKDSTHPFTIQDIQELKKAGKLPHGVKTSPFDIFIHRVRAAANAHADATTRNYLRDAAGVRTRLVETAALSGNKIAQKNARKALESHPGLDVTGQAAEVHAATQAHVQRVADKLNGVLSKNTETIKRHLEGPHNQTTMATVTRISNNSVAARAAHDAAMDAIKSGTHEGVNKDLADLAVKHAAQAQDLSKLQKELQRLGSQQKKILAGSKNPEYAASTHRIVQGIMDEHGHPYAFKPEMADAIERFERVASSDPKAIAEFKRAYMKALSKWKLGVTSVNPGYRIRNTLSDYWNMWLAGVPAAKMVTYTARATDVMAKAKQGDVRSLGILTEAYHHGVLSGLFQGDVQAISDMLEHAGSKRALIKQGRPVKLYTKITSDINRNMENNVRLAHYLYRREGEKMSVAKSAEWVRKAHFDYEDLTPFEQQKMKAIAPFYTWTRKNLPYQIERLALAPGRMAAFPKFANEMESASPTEKGGVPGYLNRGMFVHVPFGGDHNYLSPTVGVSDLAKLEHPADAVKSLLSPAIKIPTELLEHKNMMTGAPIGGPDAINPRNPVNENIAGLLSLIPGADVGPTARQGKRGEGAAPWLTYLAGQTPMTNLAVNQLGSLKKKSSGSNKLGYLTGLSTQQIDPKLQATIDTITEGKAFKQYMKGLRAEGYPMPKKHKSSQNQNRFNNALNKQLSGR